MRKSWDFLTFFIILALGSISLLVIFSINRSLAASQLVFWFIGLITLAIFSQFDYRNWRQISVPIYLAVLGALIALPFIGEPVRGSIRWIDFGVFRLQPSELAKVAAIFILSAFYTSRSAAQIKNIALSFLIILPVFLLIFKQPDLGNSLPILAVWMGITASAGMKIKTMIFLALALIAVSVFGYEILSGYQKERVTSFLNPQADPLGTGYNIIQSKIAVGSGGFLGKGLGHGSQSSLQFLPEAESDFIFASIAEQLGFVGSVFLVSLFCLLVYRILMYAKELEDRFAHLMIIGTVSFLLLQFFVNVGMNMALLPVTGITLPLISYGGSSLISTLFLLGVAFSVRRHQY